MNRRSSLFVSLVAIAAAVSIWACGKDPSTQDPGTTPEPSAFPGIDDTQANLTPLATACSFVADGGVLTITMAAGEYSLIGPNDAGAILVNGTQCGTATAANTQRVSITGSLDGGNETVILDYLYGAFALGTAATPGVSVDLKGGNADALKIRGTSGVDTVLLATTAADAGSSGTYAIGLGLAGATASGIKNVTLTNVEQVVVSTGPGDDVVKTNGLSADAGIGNTPFGKANSGSGPSLVFYGGDNNDTLNMGAAKGGAVTFNGGAGTDTADFSLRTNVITCTIGGGAICGESAEAATIATDVEVLSGGSGNDTLACEAATACTLNGNGGADVLTGGSGDDTLNGGAGDDTLTPGTGTDTVSGGTGIDTVSYADRASTAVTVVLGTGGAASTSNGATLADGGTENDSIDTVENIIGGGGADTLTGNDLDNAITGGAGNDTMTGGPGNDTFLMGTAAAGNDIIDGSAGEDLVDYSGRTNALTLTLNGSTATTGNGESGESTSLVNIEDLTCGSGADTVTGDANDNVISGGPGNDTIDAAGGNDTIDPGTGTNTITCGSGNDILLPVGTNTNAANDCEG
jgi:Ca2+-binding RTX toxin-like protein